MVYLLFCVGVLFLIAGAEALVRGASRLASSLGVAPLVIGLTVVAFGTSAPEFAVSFKAVFDGQGSIAIGNVVGSNIFNVLLILGISAIVAPLTVSRQLIRFDVPLLIGASIIVFLMGLDLHFGRLDGVLLFGGLLAYSLFLIRQGLKGKSGADDYAGEFGTTHPSNDSWAWNIGAMLAGLVLLVLGSRWLVDSAVSIATAMGVSDLIIGLTIIAAGTSLPEVVTSLVASFRGERDIAVGNVIGSNLFNLTGVLGLAAAISPDGIAISAAVISFDLPVMLAAAFACLPIFFTGGEINRWEGAVLLAYYIAYTLYLILAATAHDALDTFGAAMLYFVIPLTAITLSVLAIRALRKEHSL